LNVVIHESSPVKPDKSDGVDFRGFKTLREIAYFY
jgi:hypothetical protein